MLGRKEVLKGNYTYRKDLIPLKYSQHAQERLEERVEGELIVAPTMVRISNNNIYGGVKKGKRLVEVVVRLDYKKDKWMFLAIVVAHGIVKTVWINDKRKRTNRKAEEVRDEVGDVQKDMESERAKVTNFWEAIKRLYQEFLL